MNPTQFNLIVTATDGLRAKITELKAEMAAAFLEMEVYEILLKLATSLKREEHLSRNSLPNGNIVIRTVLRQDDTFCNNLAISLRALSQEELAATATEVRRRLTVTGWAVVSCSLDYNSAKCIELNTQLRPQ